MHSEIVPNQQEDISDNVADQFPLSTNSGKSVRGSNSILMPPEIAKTGDPPGARAHSPFSLSQLYLALYTFFFTKDVFLDPPSMFLELCMPAV